MSVVKEPWVGLRGEIMSATQFESMSLQEVKENLEDLVNTVARGKKRVEIVNDSGDRCVVICKTELDSLEKAIAILSDTNEFKDICSSLNQLAAATSNQPCVA